MDPDVQKLQVDAHNKEVAAAEAREKAAALVTQKIKAKPPVLASDDEEAGEENQGDYDNHDDVERDPGEDSSSTLKQATRVAIDEFETGEHYAEIIDGVAEEYGVDPIELAKNIHSIGAMDDDELNEFISYVEATPGEDAEEFVFGTKVQVVGPRGQKWSGIVVDPVDIIDREENSEIDTGGAASDALAQHLTLIQTDNGEYHAVPSRVVKVISRNGEDAKENERRRKTGLSHESTQITNFIKALSQKNYASANKYLQGVVESKLKRSISKANNK